MHLVGKVCINNARNGRNWFSKLVRLLELKEVSFQIFSLWSNPNKEPKLGRSCSEELRIVTGVGTGVCCRCVMRGVGGRVVADKKGGSAVVVTGTSTSEVTSVLRLNIMSTLVSGLGLSMLEMKPDDTEELCCSGASVISVSLPSRLTFAS
ncbi:hypothetical protein Tco_0329951, partial [Tanacetum coccineum]